MTADSGGTVRRHAAGRGPAARLARPVAAALLLLAAAPAAAQPLRLGGVEYAGDLPTLAVEAEGALDGAAEIVWRRSGRDNLAALRDGALDLAVMAPAPFALDALADPTPGEGDDPVVLAELNHGRPLTHLVALAEGPQADPPPPRRVGLPRGTNAEFLWWLHARGRAAPAPALVDLDPPALADALAAGEVDAAVVWEPWVQRLRAAHGPRLRVRPTPLGYTERWLLVARRDRVAARPEAVRDVLAAYVDAAARISRRPDEAMRRFEARWGVDGLVEATDAEELVTTVALDWSLFIDWRRHLAWTRATRGAAAGPVPSFLALYDPGPLSAVAPLAVGLPSGPLREEALR
jgi:ABC-type nitrate/sulfonate/bicarbonate transport system substrate-binding protein